MKKLISIFLFFISLSAFGAGTAGLNYKVLAAGGATPVRTESGRTVLATGVSPNIAYDWGGGAVLGTYSEGVMVHWTGYIKWPEGSGQKTIQFYSASDDGFFMSIDGTTVINSWREQGTSFYNGSGSITLTAGQVYYIDIWWYENGGGAAAYLYWNIGSGITLIPSTSFATDSSYWVPALCCGGSSAPFSASATNVNKVTSFTTRTTQDTKVYVEQVGNGNNIEIQQSGTKNNYVSYYSNGFNNEVNVLQTGTINTTANYTELSIVGNTNTVNITQQSTGGTKGAFVAVQDSNNTVNLQQKDNGNHYTNLTLSGGGKNVSILQQGSAAHMSSINLTGLTTSLNLTQSGSTQQFYSIQHNCATVGGCAAITVNQGN